MPHCLCPQRHSVNIYSLFSSNWLLVVVDDIFEEKCLIGHDSL